MKVHTYSSLAKGVDTWSLLEDYFVNIPHDIYPQHFFLYITSNMSLYACYKNRRTFDKIQEMKPHFIYRYGANFNLMDVSIDNFNKNTRAKEKCTTYLSRTYRGFLWKNCHFVESRRNLQEEILQHYHHKGYPTNIPIIWSIKKNGK